MATKDIFALLAFVSAFFAAFALISWILASVRQRIIFDQAQAKLVNHNGLAASLLRNGIPQLKPLAGLFLNNKRLERYFVRMQKTISLDSYTTTALSLCSLYCAGLLVSILLGWIVTASIALGLVLAIGMVLVSSFVVSRSQEKRREALRERIPDALRSMSVCSFAGLSLLQTFQQVSKEVDEPLSSLFITAVHDLETGRKVSEALDTLKNSADVSELAFVAVALDVQHRTGGSLQTVLEAARDSVESELNLKRALRVQTAQAKLSARIVSVMPFILVALFSLISPGFLTPFFSSVGGFILLGLAAFMQVAGIFLVRRLLNVGID